MHIPKSYFSEYFKESVIYLVKSKPIFFILTSIELIELTTNLIDKIKIIFRYNQQYEHNESQLSSIVLKISPHHHFFEYMKYNSIGDFNNNRIVLIIIVGLYLLFLVFFLKKNNRDDEREENKYILWFKKFLINFFDYFLFRLLAFYTLDVITREIIIISAKPSYNTIDIIL